jgi:hypothetical protein
MFVAPRNRGGAPKRKKDHEWDPRFIPLNQVLHRTFEWTVKARLAPQQVEANDAVLDVLDAMANLETAPVHVGHLLRILQDESRVPYPNPANQTIRGELKLDMTIRDILRQLPISLWPPARPGQCFHPECPKSKSDMAKHDHLSTHNRKRNWVEKAIRNRAQSGDRRVFCDSGRFLRCFGGWLRIPCTVIQSAQALRKA